MEVLFYGSAHYALIFSYAICLFASVLFFLDTLMTGGVSGSRAGRPSCRPRPKRRI